MNFRRSEAPARMICRSSGAKNTVLSTCPRAAADRAGTPLTVIFRLRPRTDSIRLINLRSRLVMLPSMRKPSASKRISSRSPRVLGERPQERQQMASRRLVFPWAFSPQITLHTGSKSTCSRA